ncbi:MAG: 50S ribosomal protein L11 methyltransferase [Clostridia bacterium]|nr:50S ribosomal protein L11 methyltransferase [Clostridia bacterium]
MDWTEIKIEVAADDVDRAGDIANMVVPYGIYIEDYRELEKDTLEIAHIDLIDEELLAKDRSKGIIHIYIAPDQNPFEAVSFLTERFDACDIGNNISTIGIKEEDWANNWKQYFKPLFIGDKTVIQPTWLDDVDSGGRNVVRIDPGMAFGTGGHATTRLCLETLEHYITEGCSVLDIGCGSGILSISSLLLGAGSAWGVDIDATAVRTAKENGEINGMREPRYNILCGDLTDKISGTYDVVVANIVADVIIRLLPDVGAFMKENSVFITCGIVDIREDEILAAFERSGFEVIERNESEGWLSFVCRKK